MRRGALFMPVLAALAACGDTAEEPEVSYEDELAAARARKAGAEPVAAQPAPPGPSGPSAALPRRNPAARLPGAPVGGSLSGQPDGPTGLEALGNVIRVDLGATLGACSFEEGGRTLLIAGAEEDSAARGRGVVQVGGAQRLLVGTRAGGPDYINSGPLLVDGDFTVQVRRGRGEGVQVDAESSQWPAELVVSRGGVDQQTYGPGTWTCGV